MATSHVAPPIFVVGAPRSGTTLLASMLAGHSRIDCGPETQFFNKLDDKVLTEAINDRQWPQKATELVTSLLLAQQPVHQLFGVSKEEVRCFLARREPSIRAMLESLTALHAKGANKLRWVEKTPNHLLHLSRIRREFPDSPIIRIVRDPRDAALSMTKLPWASQSVLSNCYLWDDWFQKSKAFFALDPKTLSVRYEDIVTWPDRELRKLCAFIGERFEPGMLAVEKKGQQLSSPNELWKRPNAQPLNASRLYAWKRELAPRVQEAATFSCMEGIEAFSYPCRHWPTKAVLAYPLNRASIEAHEELVIAAAKKGIRLQKASAPLTDEPLLVVSGWDIERRSRLMKLLWPLAVLVRRRLRGSPTLHMHALSGVSTWPHKLPANELEPPNGAV